MVSQSKAFMYSIDRAIQHQAKSFSEIEKQPSNELQALTVYIMKQLKSSQGITQI